MFQRRLLLETFRNNETSSNFEIAGIPRRKVILPETVKNFTYFVESCSRCINLSKQPSCFLSCYFSLFINFSRQFEENVLCKREKKKGQKNKTTRKKKLKREPKSFFFLKVWSEKGIPSLRAWKKKVQLFMDRILFYIPDFLDP